jgi:hypothetical protein
MITSRHFPLSRLAASRSAWRSPPRVGPIANNLTRNGDTATSASPPCGGCSRHIAAPRINHLAYEHRGEVFLVPEHYGTSAPLTEIVPEVVPPGAKKSVDAPLMMLLSDPDNETSSSLSSIDVKMMPRSTTADGLSRSI